MDKRERNNSGYCFVVGEGDYTDEKIPLLLDKAQEYGLKVSILVEPVNMEHPDQLERALEYIVTKYSSHPAFFKTRQDTKWLSGNNLKPVIFVWGAPEPTEEWKQAIDRIHNTYQAIILADFPDPETFVNKGHYDGVYNYATLDLIPDDFTNWAKSTPEGSLYVPSVIPGFIRGDQKGATDTRIVERKKGATYDEQWQYAIDSASIKYPWMITITSWNEWHEGTQIEPAATKEGYLDYKIGSEGYLLLTKKWVEEYVTQAAESQ